MNILEINLPKITSIKNYLELSENEVEKKRMITVQKSICKPDLYSQFNALANIILKGVDVNILKRSRRLIYMTC